MSTLVIVLNSSPFSMGTAETALEVALTAREQGHEVRLYLYVDGTWLPHVKKGVKGPFKDLLERSLENGVEVVSCA
ncbi:MAG: hypothetical protein GWN86_17965, partial [Desulfobacterales bacterium]|nr:hypothetical protein [Desulfobacterales bacterium]